MAFFSTSHSRIDGISCVVPKKVVDNHDYDYINETERKFLMKTTGIERKRHVETGTTVLDLSKVAVERLLEKLQWKKIIIN